MIKFFNQLWRLFIINYVLARYGLGRWLLSTHLLSPFSPLRLLIYFNIGHWFDSKQYSRGEALRRALEELGPIFVKFGQALSMRADLFPEDILEQLVLLQDKVPAFPAEQAVASVEKIYGKSLHEVFAKFDLTPIASASIAQVHGATLFGGEKVIVKILRPGIKKLIKCDIELLYSIASVLEHYWKEGKRLRLSEVVAEFERTLIDELDLLREAANASQLRRNFIDSDLLYIPKIYWDYAREKILVQERVTGIPIANFASLRKHKIDFKRLAERGVEIFFTQVFRDCFFHADMHSGNIFVDPHECDEPRYIAVDFGIMGSLNKQDQHYLAENFLAFFKRDYRRVAELHIESAWVAYDTRVDELEAAIRTVCEPIFEKPFKDISYGQVLLRLFQIGRRFNMKVQPQLMLLQKTLIAIEGLGRQLYPELDLWSTAKPYLENWLKQRLGVKAMMREMRQRALFLMDKLPELPELLYENLVFRKQQYLQERDNKLKNKKQLVNNKKVFWRAMCMGLIMIFCVALGYVLQQNFIRI